MLSGHAKLRCKGHIKGLLTKLRKFARGLGKDGLCSGLVVLVWQCFYLSDVMLSAEHWAGNPDDVSTPGAGALGETRYLHISCCSLSPFRLTFAELEHSLGVSGEAEEEGLIRLEPKTLLGMPCLFTMSEWLAALDPSQAFDVSSAASLPRQPCSGTS